MVQVGSVGEFGNVPEAPYTANDKTDIYQYDANDRLVGEQRFAGAQPTGTPSGSAEKTITYDWNATQQTSKTTTVPSVSTVSQSLSYGLTGQLEKVISTTSNGSNTVTARSQVEYRYDNSGVRFIAIDKTDTNLSTTAVEGSSTGRTEYLIDHQNFTGFQQTISETVFNESGQAVKRVTYTIGLDEITQTTSTLDPVTGAVVGDSQTLTFGHDGHGSTKVLFDAAAALMQIYTYSAYGELLSLHNDTGVRISGSASELADATLALTRMLYNGENLDTRTGLYNFRARWYEAQNARFASLDPYAGNASDPLSFNKYGFAHGDPVQGADPTGMFFGLGGMMATIGNMNVGQAMNNFMVYTGRQAAMATIETAAEIVVGKLIESVVGIEFEVKKEEVLRSLGTNFLSNMLTAGLGNKTKLAKVLRNVTDFAVRMVSDVLIGGQNVFWAAAVNLLGMAASGLLMLTSYGKKIFGECIGRFGGCFVEGTQIIIEQDSCVNECSVGCAPASTLVSRAIETIKLGSRITSVPSSETEEEAISEYGSPNQDSWLQVDLVQRREDGLVIETELIRPKWWIEAIGLRSGTTIPLSNHELGVSGSALVLGIKPCPLIEEGEGEVVIGLFRTRKVSNLVQVKLASGELLIGTNNHPIWSNDLNAWTPLEKLIEGECIESLEGSQTVAGVTLVSWPADVYNLEVDRTHVYHVLERGVLVHNNAASYSPVSLAYNYTKLASHFVLTTGQTAHHILSNSLKNKPGLKQIFQRAANSGWDINGVLNGIPLLKGAGTVPGVEHVGNHLKYTAWVERELKAAIEANGGVNGPLLKKERMRVSSWKNLPL